MIVSLREKTKSKNDMNALKVHKIANKKKFQVEFGYSGGRWHFRVGNFTQIIPSRLGEKKAGKIAEVIRNSFLRTEGRQVENPSHRLDGICRATINKIVGVRTLADYEQGYEAF
jgi:hypothetical protein